MTTTLSIRLDADLKKETEDLFESIGLNMTTAITAFLRKAAEVGGIPFALRRQKPNSLEETLAAMEEARRIARDPDAPYCDDPSKLRDFLLS